MQLAIHSLLQHGPVTQAELEAFLARHSFPLVEGRHVTFVYRGAVDAVRLRHFIFGLPTAQPFTQVPGTDVWYYVLELPPKSRVEYKFELQHGGRAHWIRDPLNPFIARDPYGANSVCQGQDYVRPPWVEHDPEAREGTLEELILQQTPFGEPRRVTVYLPARYRPSRRYNLLVVHDGGDFLRYANFRTVLDNLIHRLEVAPMIVALTHPGERLVEYPDDPRHAAMICEHLVPELQARYPLMPLPSARGLMGASFGAVASLSTAWRYPEMFGRLMLLSGSFAFTDIGEHTRGPNFDAVVKFVNAFRERPGRPSEKVFVSCGTYESLIYENRSMVPRLQATGMDVRYVEARDGHNWEAWRDRMREGLSWLFPGPLWMVYE